MGALKLHRLLEHELERLYHNATPTYPQLDSDYEQDLFQSWFNDTASIEIDDLALTCPEILKYGEVYQWGRGGRTLAPTKLIQQKGGSAFRIKTIEDLDYSPNEFKNLYKALKKFNDFVEAWNKAVPELWQDAKDANGYQEDIDENKDKKRQYYSGVRYI